MDRMITICTQCNVLKKFIHSILKPGLCDYKNEVKIMGNADNNYYYIELSDIHSDQTLCYLKRHTIFKELEKLRCELIFPQTSTSESQVDSC
jgi:hypothetical protein